jgi:hypothetical protein
MDLRFVAIITACMLVGAGAAAYHRADGLLTPARGTLASAAPEVPLFVQAAAIIVPTTAAWPSGGSVTFYDEMLALRSAIAAPPMQTPRAGTTPATENSDTVEVVIRDRFGRPIRVERIDRRRLAGGGAYPPPVQPRFHGSNPYAPYGYGPYRR